MAYPMLNKSGKAGEAGEKSGSFGWLKGLLAVIVLVVIVGGGVYLLLGNTKMVGNELDLKNDWQAVFLTNGQVYFGKVEKVSSDYVYLNSIYYLQVVTLSDQNTMAQSDDVQTQPEQRLTLIKLGNEIHGPTDQMKINRDHVVIVEDLKNDGRVVQAINDYLKNQNQEKK